MATNKITYELADLPRIASMVIKEAGQHKIWFFKGEMGSGKTTLIKEICKNLDVVTEMSSPTFSIVNEYETSSKQKIYHFDLYRVKKLDELNQIGFSEYLESGNYCLIEWPEILPEVEFAFRIGLTTLENKRIIEFG